MRSLLPIYWCHVTLVSGQLQWEVLCDAFAFNNVLTIEYFVQNTSPLGDANNLIRFTVPAGTNQGVYTASSPGAWTIAIYSDETVFAGDGGYIAPNSSDTFRLFSYFLSTSVGEAGAVAAGFDSDPNVPFPLHEVLVPSYGEAEVRLLVLGIGELLELSCEGLWPGRTNVLYSGESVSVLTNALYEFESLGFSEVLELPLTNAMGFFRLKAGR